MTKNNKSKSNRESERVRKNKLAKERVLKRLRDGREKLKESRENYKRKREMQLRELRTFK